MLTWDFHLPVGQLGELLPGKRPWPAGEQSQLLGPRVKCPLGEPGERAVVEQPVSQCLTSLAVEVITGSTRDK